MGMGEREGERERDGAGVGAMVKEIFKKIFLNYVSVGVSAYKCRGHGIRDFRVPGARVRKAVCGVDAGN